MLEAVGTVPCSGCMSECGMHRQARPTRCWTSDAWQAAPSRQVGSGLTVGQVSEWVHGLDRAGVFRLAGIRAGWPLRS